MENYFSFRIVPEKRLVVEYLHGSISWNDIIQFKEYVSKNELYNPDFNILTDCRNFIPKNCEADRLNFISYQEKRMSFHGLKKLHFITATPEQVVEIQLVKELAVKLPVSIMIFSTMVSAIIHLGLLGNDLPIIEDHLRDSKTNPFFVYEN